MENLLQSNLTLQSQNGNLYRINKLLGAGGQGEVYEVSNGNKKFALKWYYERTATDSQRKILIDLLDNGKPSEDFIETPNGKSFGYIMPLRPKEFKSIIDLMKDRVQPSFFNLCMACYNLTKGYQSIHSKGYQYRDISFGNVFFNPDNGKVLICDNDNVVPNGIQETGVLGTPSFMAPEIVRGEAKPSRNTDKFSMAVLLFYMLMINHPLEGALDAKFHCKNLAAQNKLYGTNPIFIYDPQNTSNRPVKGINDNVIFYWEKVYPDYLKKLFVKAFTDGLHDPSKRITENEWLDCFSKLIAGIVICPKCGEENFYDPEKEIHNQELHCWHCNNTIPIPAKLVVNNKNILITLKSKIFSHYIFDDYDMNKIVAEIAKNPKNPKIWGLKNKTNANWTYIRKDKSQIIIEPNKFAVISRNILINFGKSTGYFA